MSLEFIDIGNPGNPNNDPATGAPYRPDHLLIPAHVNMPGGVVVIFNNSTNDLFFIFPYNHYRIKVPATQKRQVVLNTTEPHGISYVVGTSTAVIVGQPDVYLELYAPDECVPPFNEGASGTAVASASIPATIAAVKGTVYTASFKVISNINVIDILAPAAGLYAWYYYVNILDSNTSPTSDTLGMYGGNNAVGGLTFTCSFFSPLYVSGGNPPVFKFADTFTTFPHGQYAGLVNYTHAAEGDELFLSMQVTGGTPTPYTQQPQVQIDAALVLLQPY